MASYQILGGEPTIKILSADLVRDAQRYTAQASESGIVYSLLFSPWPTDEQGNVIWTDAAIQSELSYWAGIWDTNAAVPGVLGIGLSQDVNAAGQLTDVALVTVSSSSGVSTGQISLPPVHFLPANFAANVRDARARLDAVEAGG